MVAVSHAPYLINLAGTDPLTVERSEAVLAQSLRTTRAFGGLAVIVHLGSHLGSGFEAGLERAAPVLERVLELAGDGTWLLLENTAGAGGTMGLTVEELARVIDRCGRHPWLGVCIDSCHLYASGVDVGDAAALDATLDELDSRIGLDRLKALHINDSQTPLGSNRDRHANVGEGLIGERLVGLPRPPALAGPSRGARDAGARRQGRRGRHARARAPLAAGPRRLRMRVAVVDPQAYTPPVRRRALPGARCRGRRGRAADGPLHARHGPGCRRLRAARDLRPAARRACLRAGPEARRPRAAQGRRPRARAGAPRAPRARPAPRRRALAVGAAAVARSAGAARRAPRIRRDDLHRARRAARAARATPRRCGPSCTRAAIA